MNVDTLGPSATCAVALFDGCNALDVIGFRESVSTTLTAVTLLGKDDVVKSNLGFIRFRSDSSYASYAPPQILILPGAEKGFRSLRIDAGILAWIKTAAQNAMLIVAIGNGSDVLRAADVSPTSGDRLTRAATGTEAAALLVQRLAKKPVRIEIPELSTVDSVWSTIQSYLNNQRPPYVC
jgi:putative intracellular protease/amidase